MENGTELLFSKMNPISRKIIWSLKIDMKPIFQLHGRNWISNTVEQMIFWPYFRQKSSKISSNQISNLKFWYFPSNFELLKEKSRKKLVLSLKFSVKISFESIDKWRIKRISQTKMWLKSSWEVLMIEKKTKLQTFQNNPRSQDFTDFSNLSLKKWRILCRWKLCQNEMEMVLMAVQSLVELDNEDWILISKGENFHSVEKLNIHSHWKKCRETNSLVEVLLSRNFCQKSVKGNFRNFYSVVLCWIIWFHVIFLNFSGKLPRRTKISWQKFHGTISRKKWNVLT